MFMIFTGILKRTTSARITRGPREYVELRKESSVSMRGLRPETSSKERTLYPLCRRARRHSVKWHVRVGTCSAMANVEAEIEALRREHTEKVR